MLPFLGLAALVLHQAPVPQPETKTVVFLGDSLTAGLGLTSAQAYPALIQTRLSQKGWPWKVVNAGISGDTTSGGLRRLDWVLKQRVDLLFVCLGANDGLRGIPPEATEANLRQILTRAQGKGIRVVMAGMRLPENYGPDYRKRFEAMYPRLAKELKIPLLPFLLEGVAMQPSLNQEDGVHPNVEGQKRMAEHVWRFIEPMVRKAP